MHRVLIANRGEIACRVARSCRALGFETVGVVSDADRDGLHASLVDRALRIGPGPAKDSYLRADRILAAAQEAGADAIHPGYGFLAENADFARAVLSAGLTWIGPHPETIDAMGDKQRAREIAIAAGVPVLPGSRRFTPGDLDGLERATAEVGFPLLVKAAAGGGGIGMRRVDHAGALRSEVEATQTMAARSFGDGTVYLERLVEHARHIEIQIFGFGDGSAVHFYERECSIQRRFQKVIEETAAPGLPDEVRRRMADCAVSLACHQAYRGAGTVEFVVDALTGEFFFLEMNTRIQVEHPVTEMVTGQDLVALQLRFAAGTLDPFNQDAVTRRGHALECRIYAEDPSRNFMPSPGRLEAFDMPAEGNGLRIDTGIRAGDNITIFYDPMIAKIVAWGEDRPQAIARMLDGLRNCRIEGVRTNLSFLMEVLSHPAFRAGTLTTGFVAAHKSALGSMAV